MKNTGTIEVFDGELKLNPVNSYFEGGIYNVSEDAVLNLNGKHHLKGSLTGNIEGEFWFNNYYFIVDEGETASNDLEGNGILMINNTTISGPGSFVNNKLFTMNSDNSVKYFFEFLTFINNDILNVGDGNSSNTQLRIYDDSKLINSTDGTVIINGRDITQTGGTSNIVFENDGVLQKIGNDHSIGVNMKNTGTIEVFDGELKLNPVNSYFEGGVYNVSEDAVLNLNGQHHLKGSLTGNIEGEFWFNNYYFIVDEGETASNDLEGNGILMVNNTTISGPGSFVNNKLFTMNSDNSVKYFFEFLTFINNDTLNVGDGNSSNTQLRIYDDSKLINSTDGTVIINGRDITQTGGTSNIVFENDGVLQKIGNDHSIGVNMKNTGTIEVFDGELKLNPVNSYFEGGVYNVSEDAVLNLNGQHHLKGSLTGNIEGEFWFNNYYFIVDEGETASNDLEGNGILMVNNTTISGPGSFVNNKLFTMNSDNSVKYFFEFLTFINNDILNVGDGNSSNTQLRIYDDSKLINSTDGTVIINGRDITQTGGTSNIVFENDGVLQKFGNDHSIGVNMKNTGTIEVFDGELKLNPVNSYFEGGVYNVSEDAVLNLNGQHHLKGSLTGNIEGEFWFNNYYFIVDEGETASNDLEGNGILMVNNTTISGPGSFVNNKLFTMNSDNSVKYFFEFLTFINNDTLNVGDGNSSNTQLRIYDDSKLINSTDGTVIINGRDITQTGGTSNIVFENDGVLQKIGNDHSIGVNMKNTGTIEVFDGELKLNPVNSYFEGGVYNVSE